MNKGKHIKKGILYVSLAILIPIIIWVIDRAVAGENLIYVATHLVILPLSIIVSIPLLIVGILYLLQRKRND